MKKLKRLFVNQIAVRNLYSKRIFGFAAVGAGMATLGSQAQAQVIIRDNFTSGSQYGTTTGNALSPGAVNLPGGLYQYIGGGPGDNAEFKNTNLSNQSLRYDGIVSQYERAHNGGGVAAPLNSYAAFGSGDGLVVSATFAPKSLSGSGTTQAFLGFYNAASSSGYHSAYPLPKGTAGYEPGINFGVGLELDSTGTLDYFSYSKAGVVPGDTHGFGVLTATGISPGTSIFDAAGMTTLSYKLVFNPTTDEATISDIVLNGKSYSNSYTTVRPLFSNALAYVGFGGTDGGQGAGFTSFQVAVAPEPSTNALLAGGLLALGAYGLRRRRQMASI